MLTSPIVRLVVHAMAFLLVTLFTIEHFEYSGLVSLVVPAVVLCFGYLFGRWSCHLHGKTGAVWISLVILSLLNFLHSAIDGVVAYQLTLYSLAGVVLHELGRQAVLYGTVSRVVSYVSERGDRSHILCALLVTGVWLLGLCFGTLVVDSFSHTEHLHEIIEYSIFFFLGDSLHHVFEEYRTYRQPEHCCIGTHTE